MCKGSWPEKARQVAWEKTLKTFSRVVAACTEIATLTPGKEARLLSLKMEAVAGQSREAMYAVERGQGEGWEEGTNQEVCEISEKFIGSGKFGFSASDKPKPTQINQQTSNFC